MLYLTTLSIIVWPDFMLKPFIDKPSTDRSIVLYETHILLAAAAFFLAVSSNNLWGAEAKAAEDIGTQAGAPITVWKEAHSVEFVSGEE